jgi:outer membrane autotransporter protein
VAARQAVTGIAVRAATDANVTNAGTIRGGFAGIFGQTVTVTSNSGTIESTAANSRAIEAGVGGLTVNNSGTIQSNGLVGVISDANADVTNNGGLIQATGFIGDGIKATGDATVNNKLNGSSIGRIFGTRFGIDATNANVTSTGVIGVDSVGTTSLNAIHASGTATVSNTGDGVSTGVIQGTVSGIDAGTVNVTANTGRIEATGAGGVAIAAGGDADITSAGKIQATGTNGVAIQADGTATVSNAGDGITTGVIQGVSRGIFAETVKVTANTGRIEATAANGIAIRSFGDADITSTGNILAGATAIQADGTAKVGNTGDGLTTGLIQGTLFGINARTVNVTANTGKIAAFAVNGVAVNAQTTATINNLAGSISGGAFGINAPILDVTNAFGATITGGVSAIQGSGTVRNAGTIEGGTSVSFTGAGDNTMILQTGSELIGDAVGSTASTNNNLILQGSGTASNNFRNFNTLDVQAGGTWVWNSNGSGTFGQTTVSSGTFAVDGLLFSPVSVNSGGVLAGRGTITGAVSAAGTIAPGAAAPFSTLTVQGNVDFTSGSIYRVNVGAAGQNDKLQLAGGGAANLSGGTVNVLAPNGFALSTPYTVLTATGGLGGTTFSGVTSSFASAFITPSLTYDANNVFLTLALLNNGGGGGTGFGFAGAAQTPNQIAVATALDAGPQTSSLIAAVLTQAIAGARQAFDALSGEIFGSLHNAQAEVAQFARSGMLGRMRQISYAGLPGELGALGFGGPQLAYASADANAGLPVKAAPNVRETSRDTGRDLTFWAQGLGGWGRTDGDGNAALLSSRFGGFLSGADARFGDTLRAGLVAGYVRSDVDVAARASSAGIDSVQLGAYAAGRLGAFNLRGGASWSFDSIDTSRGIFFPGFTDKAKASFHGNVGQVFGEVGYGMAFNRVAVEPLAGLAYVHLRDGSFLESGGIAALSGSSAKDNIGYSWLGVRAASAVPLANGTVLVPRATLQWQHAFGDVTPNAALAFQATGAAFTVAGIPIARDAALVEAGFEWRFSPSARLGAFYQGELAAHAQTHAVKGAFTWGF